MNEQRPIKKGSVVKYDGKHFMRVTALFKNTCNLGGIFNGIVYVKGVPLSCVREAEDEWSAAWAKSETYQSM